MKIEKMMKGYHEHIYLVFRVLVGLLFFMHGAQKWFGWFGGTPQALGSLFGVAGLLEVLIGLMLVLGLWVRLGALVGAVEMAVAFFYVHVGSGWNPLTNGGEAAVLFFLAFLVMMVHGAGSSLSLEKKLWKSERF